MAAPAPAQNFAFPQRHNLFDAALACAAVAAPALMAFNLPPSATFFNQALSLLGWGGWMLYLSSAGHGFAIRSDLTRISVALVGLLSTTAIALLWTANTWALASSAAGMIVVAGLAAALGTYAGRLGQAGKVFSVLCVALTLLAIASSSISLAQVFAPAWPGGDWIARSSVEGRAVGNLRQPNHLCSLLLWGLIATFWRLESSTIRRKSGVLVGALVLFVVALTGSRSAVLGVAILALWGLLDHRLSRLSRIALLTSPLAYALFWSALSLWSQHAHQTIGATGRFTTSGDISSSRFGIWSNTLDLIRANPWTGVGFGEFNFAWTLTEFPNRPTAFFDHTHNLPLQFAVELGLPLAALVLGLLGWGLWRAWRNCLRPPEPDGTPSPQRAAFVMLVLILMHSMLEYPLWYAYFLLPTAFLFGLCLATPGPASPEVKSPPQRGWGMSHLLRAGAVLMMLGALYSVYDYMRVVVIFAPPENAAPLTERIAIGQRSIFFSHHADYAAATTSDEPTVALSAAKRAAHNLLDTRLMMAWANALHATGDTERAKYLAQRLVEFRNPMSEPYFAPCKDASLTEAQRPYQCFAPKRKFTFEDFR